jgi:hypothetical protein
MAQKKKPTLSMLQIVEMIDAATEQNGSDNPIAMARRQCLIYLKEMIGLHGLDFSEEMKRDTCLMPLIFQELIYDGYSLSERLAPLGHIENMVEIDVIVWSGGFRRAEITDSEYKLYHDFWGEVLDYRRSRRRRRQGRQ